MNGALIIADIQNDFLPGGALGIKDGDQVIPIVNGISRKFDKVIATQDWHPENHVSFARTHGKKEHEVLKVDGIEQMLWPVHCVPGTWGASFHKDLDLRPVHLILRKGTDPRLDSYSVFLENDKRTETGLRFYLKGLGITEVSLCGLATDYCVYYSALDARRFGFGTTVIIDATRGVDIPAGSVAAAVREMEDRGVRIIDHGSL
jgi:nicotinamidase/pyrazinamidase